MIGLFLLPALAMAAAGSAPAPDNREVPETQLVTPSDLDLRPAAGQARLEQRVRSAADRLCRVDDRASPEGGYLNGNCFRAAVAGGLQQAQLAVARATNMQASAAAPIVVSRR